MESYGDDGEFQDQMDEEGQNYEESLDGAQMEEGRNSQGSVDGAQLNISPSFGFGFNSEPGTPGTDLFFAQSQIGDGMSTVNGDGLNLSSVDENDNDHNMSDVQTEGGATRYNDSFYEESLANSTVHHSSSNMAELAAIIEQMKVHEANMLEKIKEAEAIELSKRREVEARQKHLAYCRKYVATRRMKIDEIREKNRKLEERLNNQQPRSDEVVNNQRHLNDVMLPRNKAALEQAKVVASRNIALRDQLKAEYEEELKKQEDYEKVETAKMTAAQKALQIKSYSLDKDIAVAKERISKHKADLAAVKEKIAEKSAKNLLLTEEFEKNKKEEAAAKGRLAEASKKSGLANAKQAELKARKEVLKVKVDEKKAKDDALAAQTELVREEVLTNNAVAAYKDAEQQKKKAEGKAKIAATQKEVEKLKKLIVDIEGKMARDQQKVAKMETEYAKLLQDEIDRDAKNGQASVEIHKTEFTMATMNVLETHKQEDLESARKQLEAVKMQSRQAGEQRGVIRQRLAETEIQVGILMAELNELMLALGDDEKKLEANRMELDRIKRLEKEKRAELADLLALEKELMGKGSDENEIECEAIKKELGEIRYKIATVEKLLSDQAINAFAVEKLIADGTHNLAKKRAEKLSKEKKAKQAQASYKEKMEWFKQMDLEQKALWNGKVAAAQANVDKLEAEVNIQGMSSEELIRRGEKLIKKQEKMEAKQQKELKAKRELEAKVKKEVAAQRDEQLRLEAVEADVPELIAVRVVAAVADESGMSSEGDSVGSPASILVRSDSSASEVLNFAEVSSQVFVKDKVNSVALADQPGVSGTQRSTASVARAKRNGAQMEGNVVVESKKAKSPKMDAKGSNKEQKSPFKKPKTPKSLFNPKFNLPDMRDDDDVFKFLME